MVREIEDSVADLQCGYSVMNFSVIQILCEINVGESRSSKMANFAILESLTFVN